MNGTQTNQTLFGALRKSADPSRHRPSRRWSATARTGHLCRVNVLAVAAKHGLNEEKAISAFLHASRLGLFELNWNVLCPAAAACSIRVCS